MGKPTTSTVTSVSSTGSANSRSVNNIHTVDNPADNSKKINTVIPKTNNIFGFATLNGNVNGSKAKGTGTALKNSSSTFVINKKPSTTSKSDTAPTSPASTTQPGQILSNSSTNNNSIDYSVVRNHWLNKFTAGTSNGVKRTASVTSQDTTNKIPKLREPNSSNVDSKDETTADCPVCLEPVPLTQFNEHLDHCLVQPKKKKCIICDRDVLAAEYELHVTKCSEENFDIPQKDGNTDLKSKKCTICERSFPVTEYDTHVEKCLLKFYDKMEGAYSDKEEHVDCLTCGKDVLRSELNAHLEDCLGLSRVFEDDNEPVEGESADSCDSNKYNCPFCMVLFSEGEMSEHIDSCLNTSSTSAEGELNKSIFIRSLQDEDF